MDISGLTSLANSLARQQVGDAVAISVLKKAIDTQAATAAALIEAIPASPATNLPPNIGSNIDTTA